MAVDLEHGEAGQRLRSAIWAAESSLQAFKINMESIAKFKTLSAADKSDILTTLGVSAADIQARIAPLEAELPAIQAMVFKPRISL